MIFMLFLERCNILHFYTGGLDLYGFVCSRLWHEPVWHRHKIPPTTSKGSQFTCCFGCLDGTRLLSIFVRTSMAPPLICGHLVIHLYVRLTVLCALKSLYDTGVFFPLAVVLPKQIGETEGTSGFILMIYVLVYFVSLTEPVSDLVCLPRSLNIWHMAYERHYGYIQQLKRFCWRTHLFTVFKAMSLGC